MSRFGGDDYEEMFPNQGDLWHSNVQRAIKGRRGQRDLRTLEAALLDLPDKRLIRGKLADRHGGVCTVGALVLHKRVAKGEPRDAVLAELADLTPGTCVECYHADSDHEGLTGPCGQCARIADEEQARVDREGGEPHRWATRRCQSFVEDEHGEYDEGDGSHATAAAGKRVGMTYSLAWHLGSLNDERFDAMTPEERYEAVLAWVREHIVTEPVPA